MRIFRCFLGQRRHRQLPEDRRTLGGQRQIGQCLKLGDENVARIKQRRDGADIGMHGALDADDTLGDDINETRAERGGGTPVAEADELRTFLQPREHI